MNIEIKHRYTGNVLFQCEAENMRDAVASAVKSGANLSGAYLYGANLYGANLSGANLSGANLSGADLYGAYLYGADLSGAYLYGANLYGANLSGANLSGAYLSGANLSGAYLYGANLYGANLSGTYLSGANLSGAKNAELIIARQRIVPDGQIIGWKKLRNGVIAKLSIPASAKRLNSIGSRKCRASQAFVLELSKGDSAFDQHTGKLEYKVGHFVEPDKFDDSIYVECSSGIHFFLTKEEAEAY